jgi:hypothetical protein
MSLTTTKQALGEVGYSSRLIKLFIIFTRRRLIY